ncbi:MAG: hypothetical protein JJU20_13655 [Opitutales bacterium]|nr:hypothetical protein [Opitutales bacterium]
MDALTIALERPEWDDDLSQAYNRVESYLCALGIRNKRILSEVTHAVIKQSCKHIENGDKRHPVEIAIGLLDSHVASWYAKAVKRSPEKRFAFLSRVSLFRANLTDQWAHHFLRMEDMPKPLSDKLLGIELNSFPEATEPSKMSPSSIDFGPVGKIANETWSLYGKVPLLSFLTIGSAYLMFISFILYFAS